MREPRNLNKAYKLYNKADVAAMLRKGDEAQIMQYAVAAFCSERFVARGTVPDYLKELAEEGKRYSWKRYNETLNTCTYINGVNVTFRTVNTKAMSMQVKLLLQSLNFVLAKFEAALRTMELQEAADSLSDRQAELLTKYSREKYGMFSGNTQRPFSLDGTEILEELTEIETAVFNNLSFINAMFAALVLTSQYFGVWEHVDEQLKNTVYSIVSEQKRTVLALRAAADKMLQNGSYLSKKVRGELEAKRTRAENYKEQPLAANDFKYYVDTMIKAAAVPDKVSWDYRHTVTAESGNSYIAECYNSLDSFFTPITKQANAILQQNKK